MQPLERIAPGIAELRNYTWDDAPADVQAGLSVAAVAIPVAIAGLVMLILGALGVRSFSHRPAHGQRDPDDPSGTRRILGR